MPAMPDDLPAGCDVPVARDAAGAPSPDAPSPDEVEAVEAVEGVAEVGDGAEPGAVEVDALRTRLGEAQQRITNLHHALETSRTIGIAMGIVVERGRVTPTQAFDLLVRVSQKENRKLRDVAADLVSSGVIPSTAAHRG